MATADKFVVESGLQLLARLTRKPEIGNFYPVLFQNGPKHGEVIELFNSGSTCCLLADIISEALIPLKLGGTEAGVLILKTDSDMEFEMLLRSLRKKLSRLASSSAGPIKNSHEELNNLLHEALSNLFILEVYDTTQLYTTIYNLESILMEHSNISLVVFDTLTAFYWSEQGLKITKMDLYVKSLLRMIQKITKDYKTTILYTRPEYFSSSKDTIENLEACCEKPTLERLNYRIEMSSYNNGTVQVNVRTCNGTIKKIFTVCDDGIIWQ